MRIRPFVVAAMLVGTVIVAGPSPAGACSCSGEPASRVAELTDVGFIGTLVSVTGERDAIWDFDVESWIHGDRSTATIQIDAPRDGAACGFEVGLGERVAVFASERGNGEWSGGLCSTFAVDDAVTSLTATPAGFDPRTPDPITTSEIDARARRIDGGSSSTVFVAAAGVGLLGVAALATLAVRRRR